MQDLNELLACPVCRGPLRGVDRLSCDSGHTFPVVDGVPVLLRDDVRTTIGLARDSLQRARTGQGDARAPELYLESLGISEAEKAGVVALAQRAGAVDPVVAYLVAATNGILYKGLVGSLADYPIPELRLPPGDGRRLLDLGCSWGRWCIAAARAGYRPIGIDPSLGAVMAARRVSRRLGLHIDFVVADARHLPLREGSVDQVFSYSVLQHFAKADVVTVLDEVARVLRRPGGRALIQMANALGVRSVQHQLRRRLREPTDFEVRYWTPRELLRTFDAHIGPSRLSADCYFGLGVQSADRAALSPARRLVVDASVLMTRASRRAPPLVRLADSVYLDSAVRPGP